MHFPRFWARGRWGNFGTWRWSDVSAEDAAMEAQQASVRLEERFQAEGSVRDRYGYADRPLREPVLEEHLDAHGELSAVITRNAYGCKVLNTARAMFVDVDFPEIKEQGNGVAGLIASLFGKSQPAASPLDQVIAAADGWVKRRPEWSWRVYRTAAGVRLLATHAGFEPDHSVCDEVFKATGADPLYRKLCRSQKSFRARLTPKPWRCGQPTPHFSWPFANIEVEREYLHWESEYERACVGKATCAFVTTLGSGRVDDALRSLVRVHDEASAAASGLPLA